MRRCMQVRFVSTILLVALLAACSSPQSSSTVAQVEVEPAELELARGQEGQLEARALDSKGRALSNVRVEWISSAPEVVEVGEGGKVRALSVGEARIEARAGGKSGHAVVRVREPRLERLVIEPREPRVVEGKTIRLEVEVFDELGEAHVGLPVEWTSSDPAIVQVDADGTVTGLRRGKAATITARHQDLEDSVVVQVLEPVFFLDIRPYSLELLEEEKAVLTATPHDERLEPLEPRPIAWSSEDESIARVDADGVVVAVDPGETWIRAEVVGEEASSRIRVQVSPRATSLDILLQPREIRVGGRIRLVAEGRDERGEVVPGLDLQWSVEDGSVARILGKLEVEGLEPGTTRVIARDERHGVEGRAELIVRPEVRFHLRGPSDGVWPAGDSFQLVLEAEDAAGNPVEPKDPRWFSENESVARIDPTGRVHLVGVGEATVGVEVEGYRLTLGRQVAVRFVEMALGEQSTCGLAANGTVWCWGRKAVVEGEEIRFEASIKPEEVAEGIVRIRHGKGSCETLPPAVQPVCDITYGLREDGSLVAFHLGLPPRSVDAPLFVDFDAAAGRICGVTPQGRVECTAGTAGGSAEAVLLAAQGRCTLVGQSLQCEGDGPFDVDLSAWSFERSSGMPFPLSISSRHGCSRTAGGEAVCWGENDAGQVRTPADPPGTFVDPTVVKTEVRALAVAEEVSFLLYSEGLAVQGMGILPHPLGYDPARLDFRVASFPRLQEVRGIFTGPGGHRCLLDDSGRPYCWGTNEMGQVGYPPILEPCSNYHVPVVDPLSPFPESETRSVSCAAEFPHQPCVAWREGARPPLCCPQPDRADCQGTPKTD